MCGIAGIWDYNKEVSLDVLKVFTDSMEHRGPDGSGYELLHNKSLGLGHRRLSILDLSEDGKQPMVFGEFTIVYNGEIFNFLELKEELESLGHSFKTKTDTEVLLASYKEWGEGAFHKWNGMWAFALYDSKKEELLLCCDRFGIKPCYYTYEEEASRFSFASETYAFGYLKSFKKELDLDMVNAELEDPYLLEPNGYSLFKNLYSLLPGHTIRLKKGSKPIQKRWYDINKKVFKSNLSLEEATAKFREIFLDSIKLRLQSDVPLATALSGGLDSSVVYGAINKISKSNTSLDRTPDNLHQSYSIVFPNWENNEEEYIKEVLSFHGAEGNFISIDKNISQEEMDSLTIKSDFLCGNSVYSVYKLYKGMKDNGVTVSLDGHGADEMLFGYKNMIWGLLDKEEKKKDKQNFNRLRDYIISTYPENEKEGIAKYLRSRKKKGLKDFIGKYVKSDVKKSIVPKSLSNSPYKWNKTTENEIAFNYFFNGALIAMLRQFDKVSMMASVEVRMPFLDYRLVEFCFSLPEHYKINEQFNKLILRNSFKDELPKTIFERKLKLGFISPVETWLDGVLSKEFDGIISTDFYRDLPKNIKKKFAKRDWRLYNLYKLVLNKTKS